MVEPIAEQVEADQGVDPGRLDPAPAAVLLLPGDDPVSAAAQGGTAHRPYRPGPLAVTLEHLQDPVQPAEGELPTGPVRGLRRLAGPVTWLILARLPDLVQAEGEGPDRAERAHHGQRPDRLPRQPQGDVGLDGRRQVTGAAEEVGPGSVGPLLGGDPPAGRSGLLLRADAEELTEQQVLSVHRDVGFQLPLPPALLILEAEQVVASAGQRGLRAGER